MADSQNWPGFASNLQAQLSSGGNGGEPTRSSPSGSNANSMMQSSAMDHVLQVLRRYGFTETEEALMRETRYKSGSGGMPSTSGALDSGNLDSYKRSAKTDFSDYQSDYQSLVDFIDARALDEHKVELSLLLYPAFVHMYLELVVNLRKSEAGQFFATFARCQELCWMDDLKVLECVVEPAHLHANDWFQNMNQNPFVIRLAREPFDALMPYLKSRPLLSSILKSHVHIEIYDGPLRGREVVENLGGSFMGEALVKANRSKIYHGVLKDSLVLGGLEPDMADTLDSGAGTSEKGGGKNKKRSKQKEAAAHKRQKMDPNAPPINKRMPLPELSDSLKLEKHVASKEFSRRFKITSDKIPSACMYTITNSSYASTACCAEMSEDLGLLIAGFDDSVVKVWSLKSKPFRPLKRPADLDLIDKESDDVLDQMIDANSAAESVKFVGHAGPVYGVSMNPEKSMILSCSEDGTVRLWNLQLFSNLIAYKAGTLPIWDVKFSAYGHYFATGSADRTAGLWIIDRHQPVRLFVGHFSDVNCVSFHPNVHYVASGSADRCCRIWDNLSGQCVRCFTGNKGGVQSLCFSPDGRLLVAGDDVGRLAIWDVAHGRLIGNFKAHTDLISALAFSKDGLVLATGSVDCSVKLFHLQSLLSDLDSGTEPNANISVPKLCTSENTFKIANFRTKSTPLLHLQFSRRNLLIGTGFFQQ